MTYGAEVVILLETGFPTLRTSLFDNNEHLKKNLDLIEEKRENAMVQLAYYQQKLKQGYDSNVKLRPLTPGDLVLQRGYGHCKESSLGKVMTKLGRALPYHFGSCHQSVLSGIFRRACSTTSLECKQSKNVLLLINISMIKILVCYIRTLYFLLFRSHKYLNLNSIMSKVLGPDDLG